MRRNWLEWREVKDPKTSKNLLTWIWIHWRVLQFLPFFQGLFILYSKVYHEKWTVYFTNNEKNKFVKHQTCFKTFSSTTTKKKVNFKNQLWFQLKEWLTKLLSNYTSSYPYPLFYFFFFSCIFCSRVATLLRRYAFFLPIHNACTFIYQWENCTRFSIKQKPI